MCGFGIEKATFHGQLMRPRAARTFLCAARDLVAFGSCEHDGAPEIREGGPTFMNPNKALWEKGDFTRIAATMRESGEALVKSLGITKGQKVLDLGCGDGTTALPAASLGADVLGVDIAENLVAAGNRRAREQGLSNCTFREGDATNLNL